MANKTGPSNPVTRALVERLREESISSKAGLWARVAEDLVKSTRKRRVVNVSRIARFSKPNETVLVPGKVLGSGAIPHNVTVAALSFSDSAKQQIEGAKGKALTIDELLAKKVKPSEIKLIG